VNLDIRGAAYLGAVIVTGAIAWQIVKAVKAGTAIAGPLAEKAGAIVQSVNPMNRDNAVVTAVNKTVEAATGEPTFGGWLATIFNPDVRAADRAAAELNVPSAGGSRLAPNQAKALSQFDRDDAEEGNIIRAAELGAAYVTATDLEDAELPFLIAQQPYVNYSHLFGRAPRP